LGFDYRKSFVSEMTTLWYQIRSRTWELSFRDLGSNPYIGRIPEDLQ
jgi:hypothetical protein